LITFIIYSTHGNEAFITVIPIISESISFILSSIHFFVELSNILFSLIKSFAKSIMFALKPLSLHDFANNCNPKGLNSYLTCAKGLINTISLFTFCLLKNTTAYLYSGVS
jgi:hypothetical protein